MVPCGLQFTFSPLSMVDTSDSVKGGGVMRSWVQLAHTGLDFVVTTYLENTRVSEVVCQSSALALQEVQIKSVMLQGIAKGKVLTSVTKS